MKKSNKLIFPLLLVATCCVVHFWQHNVANLPYLPLNWIVPLAVSTPLLPVLTFFTTLVMLKQAEVKRPVARSFISAGAMLALLIATAVYFLSYLTYRYAAALPPLLRLPDWPSGTVIMIVTALCVLHLTGLLIYRLVTQKAGAKRAIAAAASWVMLNGCLFLVTT